MGTVFLMFLSKTSICKGHFQQVFLLNTHLQRIFKMKKIICQISGLISTILLMILFISLAGCGPKTYTTKYDRNNTSDDQEYQQAISNEPSVGLKIVDALFVRIPMIPASLASTGVFIGISPLVTIMGIGVPMCDAMVIAPWRFTAARPLGSFTGETKDDDPIYTWTRW